MAEEEVVAPEVSPVPSDHKRKLEGLESEVPEETTPDAAANEADGDVMAGDDVADGVSPEAKRQKLDEIKPDGLANENGFGEAKDDEVVKEDAEDSNVTNEQAEEKALPVSEEPAEAANREELTVDNHETDGIQQAFVEDSKTENAEKPLIEENEEPSPEAEEPVSEDQTTSRKIEVPNDKVGVLIGKSGDTIRYLQFNSRAKIQITRDADTDPHSTTRPVEIIGTLSSINKAEKLIAAVIAEADAGGSPSLVARGLPSAPTTGVGEQIEIQVPNEKVGLIIGRGGETIKSLQAKSGARIQLIPQHLPEGDGSKERTVRVTGEKREIELAREMIKDVMNQTVRPSALSSGFYQQQHYRPRGSDGPSHWGPRGPHSSHSMHYDYQQRGPYPSQSSQYPPPYGNYPPHQMAPRSNYGSGWEQRPPSMQGSLQHAGAYDYYGGQGAHAPISAPVSTPVSGHAPGPSPAPAMGPPQAQANYYGQPHGADYSHQTPYSHTAHPQHSYGHGYDEPKYDNHAPAQHHYGHGNSQPGYPQAMNQAGYGAPQQYGKQPSYGMPSQGAAPQQYGPPRASHPGDMAYQAPMQSTHSYAPNVPQQQQQYPYTSTAPVQQAYSQYGSMPAADGYNQVQPTATGYPQQGGQSVPTYGQPTPGYVQGPSGGYGSYPTSQQGYPEQPASGGYQGQPQDPAYGSGSATYGAPPSSQQAYAQPTPTQPSYDQSVSQSVGYGTAPASAPAGYGKTVSPQPAYPQYDSTQTQMYAAPR